VLSRVAAFGRRRLGARRAIAKSEFGARERP
jgi:hypothetical protein